MVAAAARDTQRMQWLKLSVGMLSNRLFVVGKLLTPAVKLEPGRRPANQPSNNSGRMSGTCFLFLKCAAAQENHFDMSPYTGKVFRLVVGLL